MSNDIRVFCFDFKVPSVDLDGSDDDQFTAAYSHMEYSCPLSGLTNDEC